MLLEEKQNSTFFDAVLIFVTNFIEYAPEGYEVNAFRYLSKQELDLRLPRYFSDALAVCRERQRIVDIPCEGAITSVAVQSIIYIESLRHEQVLHLNRKAKSTLSTRMTMANLEELLVPLKIVDGRIATSKKDAMLHGFGLQNVQSILKQYDAEHMILCENGQFISQCSWPDRK